MALSKTNSSKSYVATGLTTFEFNIPYFDSSDLVVKRQNADGTVTTLSQTASPANAEQYSVTASGNNTENGATITLGGASTSGLTYTIERIVPYTQQYDLQEGATIDPTALNKALDRTVAQNQQQQSVFDRTLVFPITDASTITYDVGTVTQRSGKALGFDTSGNVTQIDINASGTFAVQSGSALTLNGGILSANVDDTTTQITGNNIAVKTVDTAQLAASAVETDKINNLAVTTAKIADANVTEAKLASNSVTSDKISSGSVTEAKLGNDAVTNAKMASNAVGTSEIADDAVTNAKIGASAVGTTEIADNAVTLAKMQTISTDTVLGRLSAGTGAVESITVDEDISSVSANHDTLASAKAIKAYVDDRVSLTPNIAIARKSDIQSLNSVANATWYTISNLAPSITVNKTDSIYKVTADINFGADSFEDMIGFKVMFKVNSGSYTDFDLNSQGTRFSVHSGFNGHDGASGCTMAGHSFNVYKDAISGISVGDTVTFQLYIASIAGVANDFKINRAMYESGGYSNYLTGKTVLAAEEIYQS